MFRKLIILLLTGTSFAQLPDAPSTKIVTKDFIATHAIQGLGAALDVGFSNANLTSPHRSCHEGNSFFENKDGSFKTGKAIAVHSTIFGGLLITDYIIRRGARHTRDRKFIRILMDGLVPAASAGNWYEDGRWLSGVCR